MPIPVAAPLAGIGKVLGVLGGLFGKKKQKVISAGDNFVSHVDGVMRASKQFGFSPLTLLSNGQAMGPTVMEGNSMGSSIADAAMFLGDAFGGDDTQAKMQGLSDERDRLQTEVEQLTVRPNVPGIYGPPRLGGPDGPPSPSGVSGPARFAGSDTVGVDEVAPRERNTYETFNNEGQSTDVPLGPDLDEVLTGSFIAIENRRKAREEFRSRPNMEFGTPLSVPFGVVDRTWEVMPPISDRQMRDRQKSKAAKAKKPYGLFLRGPVPNASWLQ